MIDINELRRLTQAATPGPWGTTDAIDKTIINSPFNQLAICYRNSRALKDAAYIAAANPAAINELLDRLEAAESLLAGVCEQYEEEKTKARAFEQELDALKNQEPVIDTVVDYLVSISAHVAHQDDATAQAEIGDLLKMLAAGAQGEK